MLCSRCECSFYFARSFVTYSSTLLSGCMIGLIIASVVMRYQMSLLEWEIRSIGDEMDLYSRMEHDCEVDLKQHEVNIKKTEDLKQLKREKEGLELDIDIIKQLKVNADFKLKKLQNG